MSGRSRLVAVQVLRLARRIGQRLEIPELVRGAQAALRRLGAGIERSDPGQPPGP